MQHKFQIIAVALLAILVSGVLLFSTTSVQAKPNAQATATPTAHTQDEEADAAHEYCEEEGGTVTTRFPTYNTNAPQAQWIQLAGSRDFCTFHAAADSTGFQSQISIALDTLYAEEPTLAVLAYLEPLSLPPFTGANPSTLYCQKLGGTDIWGGQNNAAGGGWVTEAGDSDTNFQVVGMCVFPDMSAIDSWGLTYKANDVVRGVDLSTVVRYQPTAPPSVFVNAQSPNQPAESTVDKTLTESDNGSNVLLKLGDTLTVSLNSNPSTGYSWELSDEEDEDENNENVNDDDILDQVGDSQFSVRPNATPMPGTGGTQTFIFKAVGKGTTMLRLVYSRPWEDDTTPTPKISGLQTSQWNERNLPATYFKTTGNASCYSIFAGIPPNPSYVGQF